MAFPERTWASEDLVLRIWMRLWPCSRMLSFSLQARVSDFRPRSVPQLAHLDSEERAMGKVPVRLKEVAYALSPYHQRVMAGLWKDIPYKLGKKFHENWVSAFTLVVPIAGTYMYAENFREQEKLHHRF